MTDLSTKIVQDHNETIEWCRDILERAGCETTYRPHGGLVASRNAYLHQVMHYRKHQGEY